MEQAFRIGIAGLGTVGAGTVKLLQDNKNVIDQRSSRRIEIVSVSARDSQKDRGVDLAAYEWVDDPITMATDDSLDCIVEMIGGSEGPAKELVEAALGAGKHVVTANKALLAHHGFELAALAEANGVSLNYEAAVAGGIPIIKSLREGLAGNNINKIYGILNGTCNYILTEMRETGRGFEDILSEAQEKGFAEADPSFDVDGIDAAHKLTLLAALSFGARPDFKALSVKGIRDIKSVDIQFARELGYKIKLLGVSHLLNDKLVQTLGPCLIPAHSDLAAVEGVFNAVCIEGDFIDTTMSEGRGAGAKPTASAVVADIIDLARGIYLPTFGVPSNVLESKDAALSEDIEAGFYIRMEVVDQPGVIADISAILRDKKISIESLHQRGRDPGQNIAVVMITHKTAQASLDQALEEIAKLSTVSSMPVRLRIEQI